MRVILPGSYDPVTLGHTEIIRQAAKKYGDAYAVIFINPEKSYRFTIDERVQMLKLATADIPGVTVDSYDGRVVDYMREHSIGKIVKGYRNEADLEYERRQAEYNREHGGFETELIKADAEKIHVSSTLVRERLDSGGALEELLHPEVINFIKKH